MGKTSGLLLYGFDGIDQSLILIRGYFKTAMPPSDDDEFLIDARGHRCPVPALRLRKALAERPEQRFRLLVDDPMARIDIPHFCNKTNIIFHLSNQSDEFMIFTIQRSEPERR